MKRLTRMLPLLLLYPLYAGVMFSQQQKILFPASTAQRHGLRSPPPDGAQLVELAAPFGKLRLIVHTPPGSPAAPAAAILYTHGNGECVEDSYRLVRPLVDAGLAVAQLEFPGFCGADGATTYENINLATAMAYDWLATQPHVDPARIVALGYSMGGGAAAELTRERPVRALALMSTYTSLADIAHRYLLPAFLVRYPYDNVARVRAFDGPVFIEHGEHDEVIPFAMGRALGSLKPDITFVALPCGHASCGFDRTVFAQRLPQWLAAHDIIAPPAAPLADTQRP